MTSFASHSLQLLRQLLHRSSDQQKKPSGQSIVIDGMSAAALVESRISEAAALGATYPAAPGARAWQSRAGAEGTNALGAPLESIETECPRGTFAGAMGLAASGMRATAFLSGPDLASAHDLLRQASGRRLSMLLHIAARAATGHAIPLGSGHEAYHDAADSGCVQLFATNVQEVIDFTLIGRRVAERALLPCLVAMDGEQTAVAAQDALLPDEIVQRAFVGDPGDQVESPTLAQRVAFGDMRRRVPRWYDLQRSVMTGTVQDPQTWALGAAAARPFFDDEVQDLLDEAFAAFAHDIGRTYRSISTHRCADASIIFIAQGAAVETTRAVADYLRETERLKIGVIGVRCLRPFPAAAILEQLAGAEVVAVLERLDAPLSNDGPLMREIRAAISTAGDPLTGEAARSSRRRGARSGPDPVVIGARYGLGGYPLRSADLIELARELKSPRRPLVYLGVEFINHHAEYPKRQALMDQLRRASPDIEALGLRSNERLSDLRPDQSMAIALRSIGGEGGTTMSMAGMLASLLHEAMGGHIRTRPALTWQQSGEARHDWIVHAKEPFDDPGDELKADVVVAVNAIATNECRLTDHLVFGGTLLLATDLSPETWWSGIPARTQSEITDKGVQVLIAPPADAEAPMHADLLGGVLGICARKYGVALSESKLHAIGESLLDHLPRDDSESSVQAFINAFNAITPVDTSIRTADVAAPPLAHETPPALFGRAERGDDSIYSLSRFWDQVGVLYRDHRTEQLTADPIMATGAVPALSASLRRTHDASGMLPVFDPHSCDGDARLWTSCPDGSIAPTVLSARAVIDAGIELAMHRRTPADALRPVVNKIARRVNQIIAEEDDPPRIARELLMNAFKDVMAKAGHDAGRAAAIEQAMAAVVESIGDLPMVPTEVFFAEPERAQTGTGEFLIVAINPDATRHATLAIAEAGPHGLSAVQATPEHLEQARQRWTLWQQLPDTSGETIERVRNHPKIGALGALMLSRHCLLAMAGGDGAEVGSGSRLALRQFLAVSEYHLQPRMQDLVAQIESLRDRLAQEIRSLLANAMPAGDLDALASGLDALGRSDVDLSALSTRIDSAIAHERVDGARLGRLIDVARGLADLQWRLTTGPDGLGRAAPGLAIAAGPVAAWAGTFPYNPFSGPVAIDASGESAQFARGLLEGQLSQTVAAIGLLRWARAELERPNDAAREAAALRSLRYADLDATERQWCPPLVLVGDGRALAGRELSQVMWLLDSDMPVKVVVLADIGGRADVAISVDALGEYPARQRFDLALLALLGRKAHVVQTSCAHGDHFVSSVESALAHDGPALIHVHAPSPQRHGFVVERMLDRARLAVASRAFPLLRFDPHAPGVFGSCLDLDGNEAVGESWTLDDNGMAITPVDWAAGEARFADHLVPLAEHDPAPMPIAEFLALSSEERESRTPFVSVIRNGEPRRFRVAPPLVADANDRVRLWRTLQELAGVVTPFTREVREAAEADVAAERVAETAAIRRDYEAQLADLRAGYDAQATERVTERLLTLAGYAEAGHDGDDEA